MTPRPSATTPAFGRYPEKMGALLSRQTSCGSSSTTTGTISVRPAHPDELTNTLLLLLNSGALAVADNYGKVYSSVPLDGAYHVVLDRSSSRALTRQEHSLRGPTRHARADQNRPERVQRYSMADSVTTNQTGKVSGRTIQVTRNYHNFTLEVSRRG
jgi:hypothetical protein